MSSAESSSKVDPVASVSHATSPKIMRVAYKTETTTQEYRQREQVIPEVGVIFAIADGGYGCGNATTYVVSEVDKKRNRAGFPSYFCARPLQVKRTWFVNPIHGRGSWRCEFVGLDEHAKECDVADHDPDNARFTFTPRSRKDCYYGDSLSSLCWGSITQEAWFEK